MYTHTQYYVIEFNIVVIWALYLVRLIIEWLSKLHFSIELIDVYSAHKIL